MEKAEPAQERKLVTVLFADVTGYTGLGERLDAEQLREVMDAYFAAMREAIEAQGGTVEKFIGDAVMAVFGAPVAHEDDPARALRAAIGMRAKLGELNRTLQASHDLTLEMRVGVNSGEVMAVANPGPGTGLVTGDAVSVAARLEQNAEPGEVLVAERVARATRGFTFADVRPLSLKGKGHPVRALRLLAEERSSVERGIPGLRAPLVGRDSEMALLDTLFARVASERRPHLVTVYGDPGVGKSRLVAEFLQRVESGADAPLIVSGRCLPYGEGVTYWPLAEILKSLAGVLDTDAPDLTVEKIRKLGRELLTTDVSDEPARATAALAYAVGVEDPEVPFSDLSPRQVRVETHAAWRSLFSGLASDRPLVVLVEDIHWGDSALLDLLEELADRLQGAALLVCPARPELTQRRPAWGGGKRSFSSIYLDPLSPEEAERLVGSLLAIDDLAPDVQNRILARAEGNPFFLEEIIRQLIDEGSIIHERGRWRATPGCGEVVIPDTVQGVLAARLDLLSPEEKRVAQTAAVVGRVFWTGPLHRLLGADLGDIDDILDRLDGREFIRARLSSSIGGDREFIFNHVLTRDVAYESLPRRERASGHAEVAYWLQETAGERRREFAELLAHHFVEAHRAAATDHKLDASALESLRLNAFEHTLLASEVARERYAIEGAVRHAESALGLAAGGSERSGALEALGLIRQLNYEGDDAWRYLKQAVDEALAYGETDDRRIARLCAAALDTPTRWPGSMRGRPDEEEAKRYLDLGMHHGHRIGDSPELVRMLTAKSLWAFGFPRGKTDDELDQADADGRRAADIARRLGRPELESAALDGASSAWILRGRYREADRITRRRLELAAEMRDSWELDDIFSVHAWNQFMLGNYYEAISAADEGFRRMPDFARAVALAALAWRPLARFRTGDWDAALDDLGLIRELLGERHSEPPLFLSRPYGAAALIHEIRGNEAAADDLIEVLSRLEPRPDGLTGSSGWLTPLRIRRGDIREALALVDQGLANPRWPGWRSVLFEAECEALAEANEWERARARAPEMRAYAEMGGFQTMPFAVDRLEARVALAAGELERAAELFLESAAGFHGLGVQWEAALSNLHLGETLLAIDRRDEAAEAFARAMEVFERLGARREIARVRELLR